MLEGIVVAWKRRERCATPFQLSLVQVSRGLSLCPDAGWKPALSRTERLMFGCGIELICIIAFEKGKQHDLKIEPDRPIFNVIEVVFDSINQAGVASQAVDLSPTGDARPYFMTWIVVGDLVLELGYEFRSFRARPH